MLVHGQVGEEGSDFRLGQFRRVTLVVKQHEPADPVDESRLGTVTVVAGLQRGATWSRSLGAVVAGVFAVVFGTETDDVVVMVTSW